MGLELDPEEIFGVAVVDVGRRVLSFSGCLVVASLLASVALGMGEAIVDLDLGDVFEWLPYFWFLFLAPFVSGWGVLYIPLVLALAFRVFTNQGGMFRELLVFLGTGALLIVLAVSEFDWALLASIVMLSGCVGGVVWLGLILEQRFRRDTEAHFMGLSIENEMRRRSLKKTFGTEAYNEVNDGS
ncbi:hypothetical protein ACFQY0_11135 [Haloferula chungangensis]|uniref:Uncharacterized protein n=1 Tax=Haloferula chungangensis TaxID=1048331 RepID=A0ABW2L7U0_9BACT